MHHSSRTIGIRNGVMVAGTMFFKGQGRTSSLLPEIENITVSYEGKRVSNEETVIFDDAILSVVSTPPLFTPTLRLEISRGFVQSEQVEMATKKIKGMRCNILLHSPDIYTDAVFIREEDNRHLRNLFPMLTKADCHSDPCYRLTRFPKGSGGVSYVSRCELTWEEEGREYIIISMSEYV